jgi:hypothetical protein
LPLSPAAQRLTLLAAIETKFVSDRRSNAVLARIFQREFFAFYDMQKDEKTHLADRKNFST